MNKFRAAEVKTQSYLDLLDVLKQKEKLLGFHRKEAKIKINNILNTTIKKEGDLGTFDLSNLTMEEKIEMINLIDKSKLSDEDIFFQSLGEASGSIGYYEDQDYIDAEFEVINEDDNVVEEEDPIPLVQRIQKPDPIPQPPKKQPVGAVKNKLMQALMNTNLKEGRNQKID